MFEPVTAEDEAIAAAVIGAGIEVHRQLGPGFLEKIYQEALCLELHGGVAIPGQRLDLLVQERIIIELKAAARLDPAADARVISYLRTAGLRLALILNFSGRTLKKGIRRIVL